GQIGHPALLFSSVIEALIADFIRGNDGALTILVRWICRDEKAPFGMTLKVKALKAMIRNSTRISKALWGEFDKLNQRASGKQYRPREYLYLDKLLAKHKH
ncbi:MAG TPA: hypothetical protein VHX44_07770, partial [Planctomycetota bacterium]|nr:hypothetical protein [Planctomycetota bacterium]